MSTKHLHFFMPRRLVLSFLCLLFLPMFLLAQRTGTVKPSSEIKWQLSTTVSGVQFYHAIIQCDGQNAVLLKFNNTGKQSLMVSWKGLFGVAQLQKKVNSAPQETKSIILPAGVTAASNCAEKQNRALLILPLDVSPAYKVVINSFEFSDIAISKVK